MRNLFAEAKPQTNTLETFGTVSENIGPKGTIDFTDTNLRGEALIMVDLTNEAGQTLRAYCSPNLSAFLRKEKYDKQTAVNLVGSLQLTETTNKEGLKVLKVIMNQGKKIGGMVTAKAAPVALRAEEIAWL